MKLKAIVQGIVTAVALTLAMKWGESHPRIPSGVVVLKIDVAHLRMLPFENTSTFTINQLEVRRAFVFPRDTVLYSIQFFARPGPKTPESVFKKIDDQLMSGSGPL